MNDTGNQSRTGHQDQPTARWHTLPPRTPLEDLEAGHEVLSAPQAITEGGPTPLDEATRHPI